MTAARWELHGVLAGARRRRPGTPIRAAASGRSARRSGTSSAASGRTAGSTPGAWPSGRRRARPSVRRTSDLPARADRGGARDAARSAEVAARLDVDRRRLRDRAVADARRRGARRPRALVGLPVSIGFRLGRYGSHIREHTIQVDKTLAMLGREPTEVERLIRLVLASYGRLEALVIGADGRPDRSLVDGRALGR